MRNLISFTKGIPKAYNKLKSVFFALWLSLFLGLPRHMRANKNHLFWTQNFWKARFFETIHNDSNIGTVGEITINEVYKFLFGKPKVILTFYLKCFQFD